MAGIMVCAIPLIYYILPETKDVPLEMIQHLFKKQSNNSKTDLDPRDVEKNYGPTGIQEDNGQQPESQNSSHSYL